MKKIMSVALCLAILVSAFSLAGITAGAYSFEEMDADHDMQVSFNFESGSENQFLLNSNLSVWNVDQTHALSYYANSWVSGTMEANPVTGNTGAAGSVVNDSGKAWFCSIRANQSWRTQGGTVVHVLKPDGTTEPLVLENGVTYTVSLDYLVYKTHRTDTFVNTGGSSVHISGSEADMGCIGYGYMLTTNSNYHPLSKPKKILGTFYNYTENENGADGTTYTGFSGTEQTGSWYRCSYTFTPTGMNELDFSSEGTVTAQNGDPFLVIFRNFAGGGSQTFIDNITVTRQVDASFNGMGGTPSTETLSGFIGDPLTLPTASRFGYEFDGWYEDGACTKPFTGNTFTAALHYSPLYAGWNGKKIGFETYAPATNDGKTLGSQFSVSADRAYSGSNSMKYEYRSGQLLDSLRTGTANVVSLKPLQAEQGYRMQFKYYLPGGSGQATVYPVTMGTDSADAATYKAYTDQAVTLTASGAWHTGVLYFTAAFAGSGQNVALHVHADTDTNTTVYLDDVRIEESAGGGAITVYAGEGTIDGEKNASVMLDYGARLNFEELHYTNHAVAGYYYDAAFETPCHEQIFTETLAGSALYVKWSETDDIEHYRFAKEDGALRNGFALSRANAESGIFSLAMTSDGTTTESGLAAIGEAQNTTQYIVSFRYLATAEGSYVVTPVTWDAQTPETVQTGYTGVTLSGGNREWKTAILALKATTTGNDGRIALSVQAPESVASVFYVDDVCVTTLASDQRYVLFDTTAYGGERTAVIGTAGSVIPFPDDAASFGYRLVGWYTNKAFTTAFSETTFTTSKVVYAKQESIALSSKAGDVDGNGTLDTADLVRLKQYFAGHDVPVSEIGADVNGDGVINALDLVRLHKSLAGLA